MPCLRPSLDNCVPTGVVLEQGSRVVVMLDEGGVGQALAQRLASRQVTALTIEPGTPTEEIERLLDTWVGDGGVQGVYWLPGLDDEGPHDFDLSVWREALRRRAKALYATMRRLYDDSPFLVSATRLGGYHGYDEAGATAPMGGAVSGFTKSYKKEKPETLVKCVDFPASRKTAAIADVLVDETLRDPGAVEIGRADDKRWGVAFTERPFPARAEDGSIASDGGGMVLGPESVFVITGAAGSIVSAITADLAAIGGGVFHLLDLTPTPIGGRRGPAPFRHRQERAQDRPCRPDHGAWRSADPGTHRARARGHRTEGLGADGHPVRRTGWRRGPVPQRRSHRP